MYCNNCGKEASGNFCRYCGQPLTSPDSKPAGDTQEWEPAVPVDNSIPTPEPQTTEQIRFSKVDEAVRRRSEAGSVNVYRREETPDVRNISQTTVKKTAAPSLSRRPSAKRNVKQVTKKRGSLLDGFSISSLAGAGIASILRYISLGCMVILTLYTAGGLWKEKEMLGNIFKMTQESNTPLYVYSGLSVGILVFGIISCLWIYSRRKMGDGKKLKKYDTGRGLVPFLFFGLLSYFASTIIVRLPITPDFLSGIKHVCQVFFLHKGTNLFLCFVGIVCSILRGIKFH